MNSQSTRNSSAKKTMLSRQSPSVLAQKRVRFDDRVEVETFVKKSTTENNNISSSQYLRSTIQKFPRQDQQVSIQSSRFGPCLKMTSSGCMPPSLDRELFQPLEQDLFNLSSSSRWSLETDRDRNKTPIPAKRIVSNVELIDLALAII